ncbi:lytic murein transglycosylase [Jannaschia sp. LMIT008]|uniref:lytic murein transglycosylase n=1 Tax=Jannaschia maritima TaxID=3032585 RepID=UPI0028123FC5|nr:lytic murein transglycosylase [Jannaschia sp. LMIT008]
MLDRRGFCVSLLVLGGCAATPGGVPAAAAPTFRPVPDAGWDAWVAAFRGRAAAEGIGAGTLESAFRGAGFLPGVIERDRNQAEFRRGFEDYLQLVASEARVAEGRAAFARQSGTLRAIEGRYGVPAPIVAAIWGIESRYGARRGTVPVVSSTSTLAYEGRRGRFFEAQLLAALRILQRGDVTPERMVGSWAGAMGHTQFIPTSFQSFAVDFTGDGRRDIWSDDPTDALASTAAYLSRSGWRRGEAWGREVAPGTGGRTLRPDAGGPVFAVGRNFDVIKRYNNSDNYALAVGYLSDRIAGGGPLRAAFGPDANGLTLEDRIALQRGLSAAGFDAGTPDGVFGDRSRAALARWQAATGRTADGVPSPAAVAALR